MKKWTILVNGAYKNQNIFLVKRIYFSGTLRYKHIF